MKGINYLRNKLSEKRIRVKARYEFYELKNRTRDLQIATPPKLYNFNSCLGWCAKAVDSLADRLVFREFREDPYNLNEIYDQNNPDMVFDAAILEALIASCSFIYISKGGGDVPRMQVINAKDATGVIDPITGLLSEGYAVLERDENDKAILEAYFEPGRTTYIWADGTTQAWNTGIGYLTLVPVIYRPDSERPFGHSRISRACMSYVEGAARTVKRAEISAEFYSFPQKWVTGLNEEEATLDKWSAAMSAMLQIGSNENGEKPTIGQFQQQSMEPHNEQLRTFAALFAGETGLTLEDLGFSNGNPASADAIKAAHNSLNLTARKAQRSFGSGFLNAGFVAACLRDGQSYTRAMIRKTTPIWEPIFEPDAAMLSQIGDGAIKINQAIPGYFDKTRLTDLTGIK